MPSIALVQRPVVSGTQTFSFNGTDLSPGGISGSAQTFVVPAGVTTLTVECWGANANARNGGYIKASIAVTPGESLSVNVGGEGYSTNSTTDSTGGWNGGGVGKGFAACSGGGASDVRRGATKLVVAGGAGGSGGNGTGGNGAGGLGGANTGAAGGNGGSVGSTGGGGGTQLAGGAAGTNTTGAPTAPTAGSSGQGGNGGQNRNVDYGAGGGGGGYFGGGGGGAGDQASSGASGGGGGSNFGSGTIVTNSQGVSTGKGSTQHGLVVLTWP